MRNIWLRLLGYLQSKCDHPDYALSADELEGCVPNLQLKCCRICGALKHQWTLKENQPPIETSWRAPMPQLYIFIKEKK